MGHILAVVHTCDTTALEVDGRTKRLNFYSKSKEILEMSPGATHISVTGGDVVP